MEFLIASIASCRRQHAGDGEETGLHHRVDAAAHPDVARHLVAVDDEELRALLDQPALHIFRQIGPTRGPVPTANSAETFHPARGLAARHMSREETADGSATKFALVMR